MRAQDLWLVGRVDQGDSEVYGLIEAYAADSAAMYTLSRQLAGMGRISMSARAGQRLLRTLNANPNQGLPKALLSLSYPPAYGATLQPAAAAQGISPLLLLAVMRQESFFDPRAQSGAGAIGLTQLLPESGRNYAAKAGVQRYDEDMLFEAETNLRIGAAYLAERLADFNGSVFAALAAYNAGPNAARRWLVSAPTDADLFLETIEFEETRLYVEIVSENYAIYRYLYGRSAVPDLPPG
jgi:soluble lytic murein transglycosylase